MADREVVGIVRLGMPYVLAALYNNASIRRKRLGRRYSREAMTVEEAYACLTRTSGFRTINGRTLNIVFDDDDELNVGEYNSANGPGLGQRVIRNLRETGSIGKID